MTVPLEESVDATVPPSGTGCAECEATGGWWVHLRRCALCGHVGCCDDSPGTHATAHWGATGHRAMQSFEPGEDWFWDYAEGTGFDGPALAPPTSRPEGQTVPGPLDRLPADVRRRAGLDAPR
ncbi:UBP-type zinc finger domain-containing protein [Cellulomonas endophytica]|uniref:UBP-type zinc finger domain-containing protein n=1 Tax=Cellulomonas endophytica TaxID=2494735 RepID=UPI0010123F08|nr:UBP-type zinc finger domain-containing protein [Cellulomonas endophytica]